MKTMKKVLVLFLTALLICTSIFAATASVIPPVTETEAGETVTVDFSYNNIAGIFGTFSTTGDDIVEKITITPDSDFAGTQKDNVIAYYSDAAENFVAQIKIVLKANAKKGDECKVTFKYETTVDGKMPTTPVYEYEEAIIKIVLDYTELDKQLADAKTYEGKEDKYTEDTWGAFIKAWDAAKKARTDATTQKEVDDAAKALKDAIAALKEKPVTPDEPELDYTQLKAQMDRAETYIPNKDKYTDDSWATMQNAWDEAKALYNNANTQDEIDAAAKKLKEAIDALKLKPIVSDLDYTELKAQIDRANTLEEDLYTAESWADMKEAWDKALALYGKAQSQDEIDAAANALKAAIDALKLKPEDVTSVDYEKLMELIDLAGELNEDDYTAESWKKFEAALEKAMAALSATTQEEVDAAFDELKEAMENLEVKQNDSETDKESPATEGVMMILPIFLLIAALVVLFVYVSKRKVESK